MIGSAYHSTSHTGGVTVAISHSDWRKVRRTSRTLFDRRPSAVAIIGEEAVTSPRQTRLKREIEVDAERRGGERACAQPPHQQHVGRLDQRHRQIGENQGPRQRQRRPDFGADGAIGHRSGSGFHRTVLARSGAAKQSILMSLDCFASLAMTG